MVDILLLYVCIETEFNILLYNYIIELEKDKYTHLYFSLTFWISYEVGYN